MSDSVQYLKEIIFLKIKTEPERKLNGLDNFPVIVSSMNKANFYTKCNEIIESSKNPHALPCFADPHNFEPLFLQNLSLLSSGL
mmetsp:Transcript_19318/g.44020  ORF Transcript_19318/g.44020 Transcript_19318/m.44020 type:complete len:84 (+) Transcript_19318:320-571(+)